MIDIAIQKSFQERLNAIRSLEQTDLIPRAEASGLTLKNAGESALFEYLGDTYVIRAIHSYEEASDDFKTLKGYFTHELTCLNLTTGATVNFEWEEDDELEVSMTLDRLSFRDLTDERGEAVDEDDLDQIADDRDVVIARSEKFWYEDDWAAVYHRNDRREQVYLYEFKNESQTRFLTIEEWSGSGRDEYRIYTSVPVDPAAVTLISRGVPAPDRSEG